MTERVDQKAILNAAALFEGGLALLAFFLGWLLDVDPLAHLRWSWNSLLTGALAALPMFGLFVAAAYSNVPALKSIRDLLLESIGPSLALCRWHDLAALAAIAGLSEELLFRGVLQPWIGQWGAVIGLVGSNLIFGLAHAITPMYAVLAGGMGLYLGWLYGTGDDADLLRPIVTHAVYDWLAFLVLVRIFRNSQEAAAEAEHQALDESRGES